MKKKLLIIPIILILVIDGLIGCVSSPKDEIIGTWWSEEGEITDSLTFYNNGSVYHKYITILEEEWFNYTIEQDKLTIGDIIYKFTFLDDNLKLILTDFSNNITRTYERQ